MSKTLKIIIFVIVLGIASWFIYQQFSPESIENKDLEVMKEQIIADPIVSQADLTDEQKQKLLDRFETAKENVIALNFDTLQGINDIAQIKRALGDLAGAELAWQYANIIRPLNSLSFANLAALYHFDFQNFEKAEQNYLVSVANDPDDIPTIRNFYELYHYGTASHEPDQVKAESLLLDAVANNPEIADVYSLLGSFYSDEGDIEKAISAYEKHLELNPGNQAVRQEIERLKQNRF